jgi:hypothetical protein
VYLYIKRKKRTYVLKNSSSYKTKAKKEQEGKEHGEDTGTEVRL